MRLEMSGLVRRFSGDAAIGPIDLSVAPGEVVCLLGPSGCGKSTTLRMVAGVDRADAGTIAVDGVTVADAARHLPPERRSVGLMFQDFALFPHLSVADNVAFGLRGAGQTERARESLRRVGLAHRADAYPHHLSGGEQQRVALARALAPKPNVMLMDEPFASLDHRLRDAVRDEALSLLKEDGAAVLLVTHDPEEAMRMADRIALMRAGRIVQIGAPYHLYNNPVDREAAAFFSDVNIIHGVVRDRQTETPFGRFLTPQLIDNADVEIIIRPQHLKLDLERDGGRPEPNAQTGAPAHGRVERARFLGGHSLIEVRMDYDGGLLSATAPGAFLPPAGESVWLSLRRDRCFVFPCAVQTRVPWPYLAAAPADRKPGDPVPARLHLDGDFAQSLSAGPPGTVAFAAPTASSGASARS